MKAVYINEPGPTDHTYIGSLLAQDVVIYARSEHQARQRAVEYFRPKKRELSQLTVDLHMINAEPISYIDEAGHA